MDIISDSWQLQTAKNKFSEVINHALNGVPQLITRNGKPAVYIVAADEYESLRNKKKLKQLLLNSPHKDVEIEIERSRDTGRDIEL